MAARNGECHARSGSREATRLSALVTGVDASSRVHVSSPPAASTDRSGRGTRPSDSLGTARRGRHARNGFTTKTVHTEHGSVRLEQPRDGQRSLEPQIVPKYEGRFEGFDERIIAMYGPGMSVRDIQADLRELYGVEAATT